MAINKGEPTVFERIETEEQQPGLTCSQTLLVVQKWQIQLLFCGCRIHRAGGISSKDTWCNQAVGSQLESVRLHSAAPVRLHSNSAAPHNQVFTGLHDSR